MRLLALREHSPRELADKLARRGFSSSEIQSLVEKLLAQGWLDHYRYAESAVRRLLQKGYGPMRIQAELSQKGIPDEVGKAALTEQLPDWSAQAQAAYNRRFRDAAITSPKDWAKRARYLSSRGFSPEQIRAVLAKAERS
ncbi:regulatory protein RecX [Gallaecimonas xiamenensis]|uniref:Regulatory protein RecX n=1 Tax=Gallaecimonas xiamenensis 3-C-1 TaxID=745411 RepID=K2J8Y5_9GAMM|nr:regulatory protein RecX [Gallaecimonas xiamenensis]EKE71678.1 regulatory protein RecX [Gallaecimonas xiamenensis 3-C-1]